MSETNELTVDLRVQAVLVMDESGSEHDGTEGMTRSWAHYEVRAVYLPTLHVLCVERTIAPRGRGKGETVHMALIVYSHAAAVRAAVEQTDAAKALAKAKATEQR